MAYIEYTCVCLVYIRDVHHHNQHHVLQFKERLIAADLCKSEISSSEALSSLKKLREKLTFQMFCALCLLCTQTTDTWWPQTVTWTNLRNCAVAATRAHLASSACVFLHSGTVTMPLQCKHLRLRILPLGENWEGFSISVLISHILGAADNTTKY